MTRGAAVAWLALAAGLSGCATPPTVSHVAAGSYVTPDKPLPTRANLIGATADTLRADLGNPTLRRIDGPAEVWLYNSRICRLDVIFYPGAAGQPVVSLAKPMPRTISSATCVASLEHGRAS